MTPSEFKKIGRLLKELYAVLKVELQEAGVDLYSDEYDVLFKSGQEAIRERLLEKMGYTLEEYREAKALVEAGKGQPSEVLNQIKEGIDAVRNTHIPSADEITDLAKGIIPAPQVTQKTINKIVKERIIEKPTVIRETVVKNTIEKVDTSEIERRVAGLVERLDAMPNNFAENLEKNIEVLGMPDFRKLSMGLQAQIDELRDSGGAVDSVNGQTGVVVLDTGDITEVADANYVSDAQLTVIGNTSGTNTGDQTSIVGITGTKAQFDTAVTDGNFMYIGDAPTAHTHLASAITDFDTEVSNNTDVAANTAARHAALTVTDSSEIDFTLTVQDLTATLKTGSIDVLKLDSGVQTSLGLADTASQPGHTHTKSDLTDIADFLLESEVDADIKTLTLPASTTISTFGASLIDDAAASNARTTLGLGTIATETETNYLLASGTRSLSGDWDAGSFEIRAQTFESDVATGTAPLVIASTTKVTNLNADLLDDQTGSFYLDSDNFTGTEWTDLTDAGATTLHKHDHGGMDGLADDDHTQYALLAGRSGGQTLIGGTASGDDLLLQSTSNATKGLIGLGSLTTGLIYDEATGLATLGTATPATSAQFTIEAGTNNFTVQGDRFDLFGIVFLNRDDTAATRSLFSFKFADTSANIVDGSRFLGGKEQEWTSTVSTRTAYIGFQTRDGANLLERLRLDSQGNLRLGADAIPAAGTSARGALVLTNGTAPSTSPADTVQLFSTDLSAGNATLGLRTETALVTESLTSNRTLSIKHNGVTVKLLIAV